MKTIAEFNRKKDEEILVVQADSLVNAGLTKTFDDDIQSLSTTHNFILNNHEFVNRERAESNFQLRQIIPCGVFISNNSVLLLRAKEQSGKGYLHNKYLLWAGGHIRRQDIKNNNDPMISGLTRELREEFSIVIPSLPPVTCIIHDRSRKKSLLHIAVIYLIEIRKSLISVKPNNGEFKEKRGKSVSGMFFSFDDVNEYYNKMDSWSKILLRDLFKSVPKHTSNQIPLNFHN